MTEVNSQILINSLVQKGEELSLHIKDAIIFRSSLAYVGSHIRSFLSSLSPIENSERYEQKSKALLQLKNLLNHFDSVVTHLSEKKWIQPALNWPASYVHKYIDSLRENLHLVGKTLDINTEALFNLDKEQDKVNKIADIDALKTSIEDLIDKIDMSNAVGVQQQIQIKLREIKSLLKDNQPQRRRKGLQRRPSAESLPLFMLRGKVEQLLGQFKSINIDVDDLTIHEKIGSGGFGAVYRATRLSTSEIVAVKELRTDRLTMSSWASLYAEVETMAAVCHPFVLDLVGAHIKEPYRIITRFCQGKSLFERIHSGDPSITGFRNQQNEPVSISNSYPELTPTQLTKIAYQVAVGMEHLHSLNIVHRDLKTMNILLDEFDDSCVADFGLCGIMKDNQELFGGVGTPHYTAPEVLSHSLYGPKVDLFSYAVVLWEMLVKKVPYSDMTRMAIYEHVVTRGWRLPIPHDAPDGLKKLITRCWSKNPNDRPDFSQIVDSFEHDEIYFPGSEKLDFLKIKETKHFPPLDFEFAISCLKDPTSPHFSSICYYVCNICSKGNDYLREKLRKEIKKFPYFNFLRDANVKYDVSIPNISTYEENIDAILILSSVLLKQTEISEFLKNDGLDFFKLCIESRHLQQVTAALRFGLKVPKNDLDKLSPFLPEIIDQLEDASALMISHTLKFITRFPIEDLAQFKEQISQALYAVANEVDDQQTFDSIVLLLSICKDEVLSNIQAFYPMLDGDFIVPASFVEILIETSSKPSHKLLIFSILKATAKSDIDNIFIPFLKQCEKEEKDVFMYLFNINDFFDTIQHLLENGSIKSPLFVLFLVASYEDACIKLANSPVLNFLLTMKGFHEQRLQILTLLCKQEKFCTQTKSIDRIIGLLVASLSTKSLTLSALRLICAFSKHYAGCKILQENGILELFSHIFLTSSNNNSYNILFYSILHNFAIYNCEIPQISLIISCLMQDMIYNSEYRCEILDTLIYLIREMPNGIQEHDIQRIIIPQINLTDKPLLVHLSLQLLTECDILSLRNLFPQLLSSIYHLFETPNLLYQEILEPCFKLLSMISSQADISDYLKKTDMLRFTDDVISLLKESEQDFSTILEYKNELSFDNL